MVFNWLGDFFRTRRKRLRGSAPHVEPMAAHNSFGLHPPLDVDSGRVYSQSPWVYIAINRIAEAGAMVPLNVFRLEGEKAGRHRPIIRWSACSAIPIR